ncbi:MAG TPA: hypothetical protein ENK84_05250 [Desulfobulbus sp.]|nr:hypothetical protein [Desulfobulbus sp.]
MDPIFFLQIMVDSGLFILIWLVQLIIYPSFQYTEEGDFINWHYRYTGLMGAVVSPLMLLQAGGEIWTAITREPRWVRITIITLAWISTFTLSVPCHRRLHTVGKNMTVIRRLVLTNWSRTLLWSVLFLGTLTRICHLSSGG